jgi:hypothetical protein
MIVAHGVAKKQLKSAHQTMQDNSPPENRNVFTFLRLEYLKRF